MHPACNRMHSACNRMDSGVAVGGTFGAWTKKVAGRYGRHALTLTLTLTPNPDLNPNPNPNSNPNPDQVRPARGGGPASAQARC